MLHPGTSCWGLHEHRKPARPAGGTGSSWLVSAAQVCAGCVAQSSAKPTPRQSLAPVRAGGLLSEEAFRTWFHLQTGLQERHFAAAALA